MSAYGATPEDAQDVTAFRLAEKKYQLHMQQQMRYRGGRMRGGKLVAQPTDLSDVIDIRNAATADTKANLHVYHLTTQPCSPVDGAQSVCCSDSCSCGSCTVEQTQHIVPPAPSQQQPPCRQPTALFSPEHPGLTVFPNALSALQQLQLMRAALAQWPEHPTRTNHTKVYGSGLTGLFAAAQAGMVLLEQPLQQPITQHQNQGGALEQLPHPTALQQVNETPTWLAAGAHAVLKSAPPHCSSYSCDTVSQQQQQQQGTGTPAATAAPLQSHCNSSCCFSRPLAAPSPWSAGGKGPRAAVLLRKLRWASLGPPFNWTDRVYEHHVKHTPLPPELADTGRRYAALAAEVSRMSTSSSCRSIADQERGSAQAATGNAVDEMQQGGKQAPFVPGVALVNYYHAGDTLGGHKDDVEPDMTQPIVTMSLGCEAVFLIGGSSRDRVPTALLLRSGDVVVLGGPARSCYHGVPRIFTDKELPDELAAAVKQFPQFAAYLEYFKQCRVNISVRCVS